MARLNSKNYRPEVQKTIDLINNEAAEHEYNDDHNPEFLFSCVSSKLLARVVTGEIDPVAIARLVLAGRGQIPHANNAGGVEDVSFDRAHAALLNK